MATPMTSKTFREALHEAVQEAFGIEYDKYKDDPRMPVFAEKPSYEIEVDFD